MSETELVKALPDMELGKIFAESGMFPDIKSAAQGYVKILAGRELGMSPMQSISVFYFVGGRLGIVANAVGALIKRSGKYDYEIDSHTDQECSISFYKIVGEKREKINQSRYDIKMAAKAGLVNKDNWKNHPMNMLFARALMNGQRWYCPDVTFSMCYSVEELQDLTLGEPVKTTVELSNKGEITNGKETV